MCAALMHSTLIVTRCRFALDDGRTASSAEILEHLGKVLQPERLDRIRMVICSYSPGAAVLPAFLRGLLTWMAQATVMQPQKGMVRPPPSIAWAWMQVASNRTFSIVPLLEGINDKGNVGAVARSADALG